MSTDKSFTRTTWFSAFVIALALANMVMLAAFLTVRTGISLDNGISKVSDEDAHCYVHRDSISCVPATSKLNPVRHLGPAMNRQS